MQDRKPENRYVWMDILKIISAYAIVLLHISGGSFYGNYGSEGFLTGVALNVAVRFAVPCFLLVTGALTMEKKYSFRFALRRAAKYFLFLLAFTLLYLIAKSILWPDTVDSFRGMYVEALFTNNLSGHLWYLYQLVWIWMLLPFVQMLYQRLTVKQRVFFAAVTLWIPGLLDFVSRMCFQDPAEFTPNTSITVQMGYIGILVLGGLCNSMVREHTGWRLCGLSMVLCVLSVLMLFSCTVHISNLRGEAADDFFAGLRIPALLYGCSVFVMFGTLASVLKVSLHRSIKRAIAYVSDLLFYVYGGHCLLQWWWGGGKTGLCFSSGRSGRMPVCSMHFPMLYRKGMYGKNPGSLLQSVMETQAFAGEDKYV